MSILKQKLDQASEQFQNHNFQEALKLYQDCLNFCDKADEPRGTIHNIMTTKGALLCILGELQRSISILNEVLRSDPNHYLGLLRRSQVYKKKGKFNRALKDLQTISSYCPDNLQITAMKLEIQKLKAKSKHANSSEESEEEQIDEYDEELQLNFSNLKKIDRKSCSIMAPIMGLGGRKSLVTISGDTTVEYQTVYDPDKTANSTPNAKEAKQKFMSTLKEIETDDSKTAPVAKIVAKGNPRSKSILKNSGKGSLISTSSQPIPLFSRDSCLIQKIKNIDGKMIEHSVISEGPRQVEFRKSLFVTVQHEMPLVSHKQKNKGGRKSCMRPSTYKMPEPQIKPKGNAGPRSSKFDCLSRKSIDGAVIKNRKSFNKEEIKENLEEHSADSDDDTHNIFGNQQVILSKQLSNKLGLDKEESKAKPKGRAGGGKSILKKNSVLVSEPIQPEKKKVEQVVKPVKKAKKSVMFHGNSVEE